jgi:hypothetical protein
MNLRKLLCGLLALSLLMTLAPAALMEEDLLLDPAVEDYVGEVVEDLGGEESSDSQEVLDLPLKTDEDAPVDMDGSSDFEGYVGSTYKFTFYRALVASKAVTYSKSGILDTAEILSAENGQFQFKALKKGDVTVTVKFKDGSKQIINVKITNETDAKYLQLKKKDASGDVYGDKATVNGLNSTITIYAEGLTSKNEEDVASGYGRIIWTVDNKDLFKKITTKSTVSSEPLKADTLVLENVKKAGTVKITAKLQNDPDVSKTLTLTITTKNQPTKVTIEVGDDDWYDSDNKTYYKQTEEVEGLYLYASVQPDSSYHDVTWTVDKQAYAAFIDKGKFVNKLENKSNENDPILLYIRKGGTVKITATTANGKSNTLTLKIVDKTKASALGFAGLDSTSIDEDLYKLNSKDKIVANTLEVQAKLYGKKWDSVKKELVWEPVVDSSTLKKVTWKSSDTSIATVAKVTSKTGVGKVTFKKAGTVKITVSGTDLKSKTLTITVKDNSKVNSIYVLNSYGVKVSTITLKKGNKAYFNIYLDGPSYMDENIAYRGLTYKLHHSGVVTVGSDGLITAKGTGTAKIDIKSKDGKTKKTMTVKVTK